MPLELQLLLTVVLRKVTSGVQIVSVMTPYFNNNHLCAPPSLQRFALPLDCTRITCVGHRKMGSHLILILVQIWQPLDQRLIGNETGFGFDPEEGIPISPIHLATRITHLNGTNFEPTASDSPLALCLAVHPSLSLAITGYQIRGVRSRFQR